MGDGGGPRVPGEPGGLRPLVVVSSPDAEVLGRTVAELRASARGARVVGVLGGPELARDVVEDLIPAGPPNFSDRTREGR